MKDRPIDREQWLKDMPVTSETPGFKPEEMVACEKCARKNPPTRVKCFYCGEELKTNAGQNELATPTLRQMESWEKGFNLIRIGSEGQISESSLSAAAVLFKREPSEIKSIFDRGISLPLARTDSLAEAELIKGRLAAAGIEAFVWPDEEVSVETPTRRLRGFRFEQDTITFLPFNKGDEVAGGWSDVVLVVAGGIFEKKISSTAKRSKNEEKQITESTETSRDEAAIDVYTKDDDIGWRIMMTGFDFSCLGEQKGMLAVENIKRLLALLRERAPNARFDDNYLKVRAALGRVWENEEKMASHKWEREGMGKFHFDNVTVVDNVTQFTRYSRLQKRLLKK